MRRFVVIGQTATASPEFSLNDIAGTAGRLDVLLRCLRAALCVSHGLRDDTTVYLVLLGGERAPRVLRIEGAIVRFVRPDERSLGTLVQKALAVESAGPAFTPLRRGVCVAEGALEVVLADLGPAPLYLLEEGARDVRAAPLEEGAVFFLGDHRGFDAASRARLLALGARAISVGPVSVHADDVVTLLANELDRAASPAEKPQTQEPR